ncbi:MAG: DNA adenine methylase [Candidatus Thiodiazotropha taylori]
MEFGISYMGTKKFISPYVNNIVSDLPGTGPFLDLFSGMCSVSSTITNRPIWCNDTQLFATYVAKLLYKTKSSSISTLDIESFISPFFEKNFEKLENRFLESVHEERLLLSGKIKLDKLIQFYSDLPHVQSSKILELERKRISKKPDTTPWRLFSITYAGGYFGILQCIEIDSIRYGIEKAFVLKKINKDQYIALIVALANALSRCSTTTGHFAQFLNLNKNNLKTYVRQRRRSIWLEWITYCNDLLANNSGKFNRFNRVFNKDANILLQELYSRKNHPEIVYADPPYTKDQYSRFYHIYETLIKYNYPESFGMGRYPPTRFRSKYCLKTNVQAELNNLITRIKKLGCQFILSYPENGIIEDSKTLILSMLRESFQHVELVHCIPYAHSTMGASKGKVKHEVNELIFLAR